MKIKLAPPLTALAFIAAIYQSDGQNTQFFRISGPAATTIDSFNSDGSIVWSDDQPGTNYIVQRAASLTDASNWIDYVQLFSADYVNTNIIIAFFPFSGMAFIPGGPFTMGDTLDGEGNAIPPTNVTVSAFFIDKNLVSYAEWQTVYSWAITNGYGFDWAGSGKATNHPVQTVNWYDAVKWCNARSAKQGKTPMYYTDMGLTQIYTNTDLRPYVSWLADGYRLPTEAEWEKAARGGLSGQRFPWGDTISEGLANYYGNTNTFSYDLGPNGRNAGFTNGIPPYTSPVGDFAPNGYGVYDMAGNVWEWCWDWYANPPFQGGADPRGPSSPNPGNNIVVRGGNWADNAYFARCADRNNGFTPSDAQNNIGFRCVKGVEY